MHDHDHPPHEPSEVPHAHEDPDPPLGGPTSEPDPRAPPDAPTAPPGHYLLFLVDSRGVPSLGRFVRLP